MTTRFNSGCSARSLTIQFDHVRVAIQIEGLEVPVGYYPAHDVALLRIIDPVPIGPDDHITGPTANFDVGLLEHPKLGKWHNVVVHPVGQYTQKVA